MSTRFSQDRALTRAIFFAALGLYLLTSGREPPWGDGHVQYMVAENMVRHRSINVDVPWPDDLPPGRGGKYYSTYPILISFTQVPGLLILEGVRGIVPAAKRFVEPLTSHLACSIFGALTCVLFFRLCRRLGVGRRSASVATLFLAVGSTIWVYAHYSYSEILQAAFFTGFVTQVLDTARDPNPRTARRFGVWAGLLFSVKYIYAVSILGAGVLLIVKMRKERRQAAILAGWSMLAALPFLLLAALYNYACWGSFTQTGYHPYFESYWGENILIGLWGIFFSPGKSLFLYSPPLILGLLAVRGMIRRDQTFAWIVCLTVLPVLIVYSRYKLNGDYAWGPRFVVFAVPVLMTPFALLVNRWLATPGRQRQKFVLVGTLALGGFVQVLGNSFYWDHFIRISMSARTAWLGTPNRSGAIIPVRRDGHCDSCFEDVHQLEWLPPFQPILGHFWLLRSTIAGKDWKAAEADAPWHRHTKLALNIKDQYAAVRFDWWGMLWLKDFRRFRLAGTLLLLLLSGVTGFGGWRWWREHSRLREEAEMSGDEAKPIRAETG